MTSIARPAFRADPTVDRGPAVDENAPHLAIGHYMIRIVKGGPEVPACIQYERTEHEPGDPSNTMDRSPILTARIGGDLVRTSRVLLANKRPITRSEYEFRMADLRWHAAHGSPTAPLTRPDAPIDPLRAQLPF